MSFLGFRQARRKAKKIVSVRSLRPPTPPSPGSFISTSVVEIGDPSGASVEEFLPPVTLHVDIDITPESLRPTDPYPSTSRNDSLTTNSRQSRDRLSRPRLGGVSHKPLHDGAGLAQPKDSSFSGSTVEGATRTPVSRRVAKATLAPIMIPTTSHASRVHIERSARKSVEPRPTPTNTGDSPSVDDCESSVSGITLPGGLIANVWTVHADQPRDHCPSRRITRIDSATLPVGDRPFMNSPTWKHLGLSNGDGEFLVPRVPPPPVTLNGTVASELTSEQGKADAALGDEEQPNRESSSRDQLSQETPASQNVFSACKPSQFSPITELMTPDPSDPGTPDLMKDSCTSADGGSSDAQPNTSSTSDSAPSAWSGLASSSSAPSGEEITMVLDVFSAAPSDPKLPTEKSSPLPSRVSIPTCDHNLDDPAGSRTLPVGPRRTGVTPECRRLPRSRSSSRPSFASVNTFLLHPATLITIGDERRVSFTRTASESVADPHVASPDDADKLSVLPQLLATRSMTSQPPSYPESGRHSSELKSSDIPSSLGSPSSLPSPDLLDNIVLADESCLRRRERHTFASMSMIPGSGAGQTFPETPHAFSPMFSPGIDLSQGNVLSLPDSSTRRTTSLRGRSNRLSRRFVVGRSASTKAFVGMKAHNRLSTSKLKRSSTGIVTPAILSPLPTGNAATTTKLDQVRFGNDRSTRPRSIASDDSSDHAYSRRPAFPRQSESQKKTIIPLAPLAYPPSPPSQTLSTQETAESPPSPVSPSLVSLPPPPPPPN
ncbi:hypothetical protein BJV74DRAFT_469706 [Russula compacta]|nr:hypothetical protein BJV74DRAFT_469706 [Russula compacta]